MKSTDPLRLLLAYINEKGVEAWFERLGATYVPAINNEALTGDAWGLDVYVARPLGAMAEVLIDHFDWLAEEQGWTFKILSQRRDVLYRGQRRHALVVRFLWLEKEEEPCH